LLEKDRLEEEACLALKQKAKKELEDWYTQHSEQVSYDEHSERIESFQW